MRSGYYTINDIRLWEDLPPVEGGDIPLISGDLYPINTPLEERKTSKGGDSNEQKENLLSNEEESRK